MVQDQRLELRVSADLLARLDVARGGVPRGTFVKRVLEQALGGSSVGGAAGPGGAAMRSPAPARVSAHGSPSPSLARFSES